MPNRLADSRSPYLRQHQDNPVDWYPWGEEAFARAKAEDKPIFLSIGYSACHWCHVMAHESFEDPAIAALLNEHCINVKVDREERPDVDETYMTAVQLSSGRGGWPMTVFLTPDKKPFFAGTYFPKDDRGDYPGFRTIVSQVVRGWAEARLEFEHTAHEFSSALADYLGQDAPLARPGPDLIDDAIDALWADFDEVHGGFGGAPKFPPHSALEFILHYALKNKGERGDWARKMAQTTLDNMRWGGIHDHVGGGYHRYSTDGEWRLPHFEKMLYDNALLLAVMPDPADIAEWLFREMRDEDGLFMSALDADSEGEEGKFYVWTYREVVDLVGESFADGFDIRLAGNFHDEATGQMTGANVLYADGETPPFTDELLKLRNVRETRIRPGLDDKVITGWNGLAIAGLARASKHHPEYLDAAKLAATKILEHDPLPRIVGAEDEAFLEDYAAMAYACHCLAQLDPEWRAVADRLTLETVARFADPNGGYHATGDRHEVLFGRTMPVFDTPIPSGNALALRALLRTDPQHPHLIKSFARLAGWMRKAPQACDALILAYTEFLEVTGPAPQVRIEVELQDGGPGLVTLFIPEGCHLQGEPSAEILLPASGFCQEPMKRGNMWRIPIRVNSKGTLSLKVHYQLCTESLCLPPDEQIVTVER